MLEQCILQALNGLVWGVCIALIAVGLTLVFGLTEVINISHGEFFMAGAVLAYYIISWTHGFWWALLFAPLICGIIGLILERTVLRARERTVSTSIIATFGIALILQQTALLVLGPSPQRVNAPVSATVTILGSGYPLYRLVVVGVGGILLIGLAVVLYWTKLGLWIRAVRYNREMALALGVPVASVYALTFGLGTALAAAAGVLMAPITAVEFRMGTDILPLAFMAVIVGGLGSLAGTLSASLILGISEGLLCVFVSPILARVLTLMFLCFILLARPHGVFGLGDE